MVTRFTQEIIPFHLALCKFWKEKFITCFHFRSSSKSTYFPNRKILIQNSYLASSEMGSTPWTKWTWRFFLSFSNSNFHFLLNFEKIGDPNENCFPESSRFVIVMDVLKNILQNFCQVRRVPHWISFKIRSARFRRPIRWAVRKTI